MAYRATRGALRAGAMNNQGALYDLLESIATFLNVFSGATFSLERQDSAPAPTLAATAAELNRVADVSARMVTLSGATSITEATHDGKVLRMTGTGSSLAQTLPAATGSGARFLFIVGAVNTSNHVIKVTGNDVMYGNIITNSTGDNPDLAQPWPTAVDSDTITLNGTTTGGAAIGDWVECIDIAADTYFVRGVTTSSGSEATPFSAGVT